MVAEGLRRRSHRVAVHLDSRIHQCAFLRRSDRRKATVQRVGLVRRHTLMHRRLVHTVPVHLVDVRVRAVHRYLGEVRSSQLREVVGGVRCEGHRPQDLDRCEFLRHDLRRVQQVYTLEQLVSGVGEDLHPEIPLGKCTTLDGVRQVAPVEVRVHPSDQLRLLPQQGVHAPPGLSVELHQTSASLVIGDPEGMNPEALHHAVRTWDAPVRHVPDRMVRRLGVQGDKVPERVMGTLSLRDLTVGMRLTGMGDVGELDPVLDGEDRNVVADQVPGAFRGVELHRETAGVPDSIGEAARTQHGGKSYEDLGLLTLVEDAGPADPAADAVGAEHPVCCGAPGVDDTLGNPLGSKWVIFSRSSWSCRRTGPRSPAFRDWSAVVSRPP